jgi:type IV pilus assembly protein PilM
LGEGVLQLTGKKQQRSIVGLDIEASSVAAAEVAVNGSARVTASAIGPLEPGAFHEGEVTDSERVAAALKSLFGEHKLSKRVRLGIGNQRVVVRALRLPAIEDPKEMDAAVRFQAQEQMPIPLEEAVLEHQVVGGVPAEEGMAPQVDVIVVAARRDMVHALLDPVRRAGLEAVGIDLAAFGMIRALAGVGADTAARQAAPGMAASGDAGEDAILYCNLGDLMNLAVARGRACLFTRVATTGLEATNGRLVAGYGFTPEAATQWLTHVGLETPLEQIEGDTLIVAEVRQTLEGGVFGLVDELRLSRDYYAAREGALPVGRIVLSGPGSAIPGLPERIEAGLGLPVSISRPAALAGLDAETAARLTLPYGLALEG